MGAPDRVNRELMSDFDIEYPWSRGRLRPGTTGVLRVRNEARSLPWVLPPLLRSLDEVIVVDNLSDDGTPDVARAVAADHDLGDRLRVESYPIEVSRCGPEHLATPPDSVHSLTWFYEWSFSLPGTTYSLKWDGDMVLTREGEAALADLAWQVPGNDVILNVPRPSLYVESDSRAYIDLGSHNAEPFGSPQSPEYLHIKAFEWELRAYPDRVEHVRLPERASVELKWLDADEFAHWTDPNAFANSPRTTRKRREWNLVNDLRNGDVGKHEHVRAVEAPAGRHIIEYVTQDWLPGLDRASGA